MLRCLVAALLSVAALVQGAAAAELKVLTAGAMKSFVLSLQPGFEAKTGHKLMIDNDTAGGLEKRILAGEKFDVVILTPPVYHRLVPPDLVPKAVYEPIARSGIGVGIKDGAAKPDISDVEKFKAALVAAKAVAYVDPKSGGTSGIYFDGLLEKLGIADAVRAKAKLKAGGYAAEFVASGEADLVVHQISEILPVKGVALVGPLPEAVQKFTDYAGTISSASNNKEAALAFLAFARSPEAQAVARSKGMQAP